MSEEKMSIEEQLRFVDDYYERVSDEVFPNQIYQACKILIKNKMAEIHISDKDVPRLVSTEIGRAMCEAWDQEVLQ